MSRAAVYQLFRHIPDVDESTIDQAIEGLTSVVGEQTAMKVDVEILVAKMWAGQRLVQWMIGILSLLLVGMFWMQFHMAERLAASEERQVAFKQYVDDRFTRVDEQFTLIDERFDLIDERFDLIDERFALIDEQFARIDKQFAHVDERFTRIDDRLARIEEILRELADRQR